MKIRQLQLDLVAFSALDLVALYENLTAAVIPSGTLRIRSSGSL